MMRLKNTAVTPHTTAVTKAPAQKGMPAAVFHEWDTRMITVEARILLVFAQPLSLGVWACEQRRTENPEAVRVVDDRDERAAGVVPVADRAHGDGRNAAHKDMQEKPVAAHAQSFAQGS